MGIATPPRPRSLERPYIAIFKKKVNICLTKEKTLVLGKEVYKIIMDSRYKSTKFYLTEEEYFQYLLNGYFDNFIVIDHTTRKVNAHPGL